MSKFKVGDRVKCIDSTSYGPSHLIKGNIYTVSQADVGGHKDMVRLKENGQVGFYEWRFELAGQQIDVSISGTVKSRANGVVTVDTEHGAVVLPEAFAPPEASQGQREAVAQFLRNELRLPHRASVVMTGKHDAAILKLVEALNVSQS